MWVKTKNSATNNLINTDKIVRIVDMGMSGTAIHLANGDKISSELKYQDWITILSEELV